MTGSNSHHGKMHLRPCPFCASIQVHAWQLANTRWIIECDGCLVHTPAATTKREAYEGWNLRAADAYLVEWEKPKKAPPKRGRPSRGSGSQKELAVG